MTVPSSRRRLVLTILIGCCSGFSSLEPASAQVRWRTGTSPAGLTSRDALRDSLAAFAMRGADRHFVATFAGPVLAADREALAASGITLLSFLGDNAFFAVRDEAGLDVQRAAAVERLTSVQAIEYAWKVHPDVLAGEAPRWSRVGDREDGDAIVAVYVVMHADVLAGVRGAALVAAHGGAVRSVVESINMLVAELPQSEVRALAEEDDVQWLEWPLPAMAPVNSENRSRTGANIVQDAPYELDGDGITVLVYDGGSARATHVDFGGRLTVHDESQRHDHPTHVACTIGGNGAASSGANRGMAPGVTLLSYGFEIPSGPTTGFLYTNAGDIEDDFIDAVNVHGAQISNASIGTNVALNGFPCSWEGDYGSVSALIDAIVGGSLGEPFRMVWANGNERGVGTCGTMFRTVPPPAPAKNHIAVGALNADDDSMTDFSSWGPTDDGRLKPDVSAPGCQSDGDDGVTSCSNGGDNTYRSFCGTSMAAPTVTGLSALILQDYHAQFPSAGEPLNATLKTLFAHTAADIENPGPDFKTGYGSVRIQAAIDFMRAQNFFEGEVDQGETYLARVLVTPADTELRVTIAWDDRPGTPNVVPNLVNDLDIVVRHEDGTRFYPWTLDPANPANPAVRTQVDRLNNIEQVVIDTPAPGIYFVEVVGHNVPFGPQSFAVAGSPLLVNCSESGKVAFGDPKYACEDTVTVEVVDCGLNLDDAVLDTVVVAVNTSTEPGGEAVVLTESGSLTARFVGSIPVSAANAAGVLQASAGDLLGVVYLDLDNGDGGFSVLTATGDIDCTPPVASNIHVTGTGPFDNPFQATVNFELNEPATAVVRYGVDCGNLDGSAAWEEFEQAHAILLTGLEHATNYFYAIDVIDEVGNLITIDNAGACYSFTTTTIPEYLTEQFDGGIDLAGRSVTFTPNGSFAYYNACVEPIVALPIDPAGGVTMPLTDNASVSVALAAGAMVSHYGTPYATVHVGSNGYLTFGSADFSSTGTIATHFSKPRIAALYTDLNPTAGGTVRRQQLADRFVVTYQNVPEYPAVGANTAQVEMFFDGRLRLSYLGLTAPDAVIGLSRGEGIPPFFYSTDLTGEGDCQPHIDILPAAALPATMPPAAAMRFNVRIIESQDTLVPGTGLLHYRFRGDVPFATRSLTALGGDLYEASIPPTSCATAPEFYVTAEGAVGGPVAYPSSAPAQTVMISVAEEELVDFLEADFEAGLPAGWTATGLWNVTDQCDVVPVCEGASWAYYGQPGACNYNTGARNFGALTAPQITLPQSPTISLSYCSSLRTENFTPVDKARVYVNNTVIDTPTGGAASLPWATRTVNLAAYAGQTVTVRWDFDTVDGNNNAFPGWQVDRIRLTAQSLACSRVFDLETADMIAACMNGPGVTTPPAGCTPDEFHEADVDRDGDVDLADAGVLQLVFEPNGG